MINKIKQYFSDHTLFILILLAFVVSICSFVYYYSNDQLLLYGDASTHLNISRRVVDNLTPGFGQLGGTWLPLFHILMLPTIWNDFMWHSGISAYIVNSLAFVIAALFVFKLLYVLTENKGISFLGGLLLISNPNLIYIHTTAMNETLFIATLLGSAYFLANWSKYSKISDLILAGFMILLTTFNRYEGWFVFLISLGVVLIVSLIKNAKLKDSEGIFIIFASSASLGIFFWFLWQLIIFGDPLYFLHSVYSAKTQTMLDISQGNVPTYHNIKLSILTYWYAVVNNSGILISYIFLGSFIATITVIISNVYKKRGLKINNLISTLVLVGPIIFECYALFNGNIPLEVPQLSEGGTFNIRFGIYMLPAVIVYSTYIISKFKYAKLVIASLLTVQCILFYSKPPILLEAARSEFNDYVVQSAEYLNENYDQGYILISNTVFNSVIIRVNTDMDKFISEGSGHFWDESIVNPAKYASWIILSDQKRDMINIEIGDNVLINKDFALVKQINNIKIYKKIK